MLLRLAARSRSAGSVGAFFGNLCHTQQGPARFVQLTAASFFDGMPLDMAAWFRAAATKHANKLRAKGVDPGFKQLLRMELDSSSKSETHLQSIAVGGLR